MNYVFFLYSGVETVIFLRRIFIIEKSWDTGICEQFMSDIDKFSVI